MIRKIKWFLLVFLLSAICSTYANAQTINAASCSASDVQNALNSVAKDGTTVTIPSGTCTWTTQVAYNAGYSATIMGATTCTGSGTPTNPIVCTDSTNIIDHFNHNNGDQPLWNLSVAAGKSLRLSGVTISYDSSSVLSYQGPLTFSGSPNSTLRVDHVHFNQTAYLAFSIYGSFPAVFDHMLLDGGKYSVGSGWRNNGDGEGDAAWAAPTGLGTANFQYFENNTFNDVSTDCIHGGRWVVRFSTFNNNGAGTHPTGGSGRARGCRAWELYKNSFINPSGSNGFNAFFISAGTGVVWGNSAPGYSNFVTMHSMRRNNGTYSQTGTPNGWGYCGTSFTGTGSNWDQNTSTTTGNRCMDQPGQGQGDLLSGQFPNTVNKTTGTIAWPRQALEPIYEWMDTWSGGSGGFWSVYEGDVLSNNLNYYLHCAAGAPSGCPTFNGTVGVGSGALASRPATCTTGVAYWATDQGNWNQSGGGGQGQLYKCTATNSWTLSYTPYTYPHPLVQGSNTSTTTIAPPTNLSVNVQ